MTKAKFGTFDDSLQVSEEAVRPIASALRETVFEVDQNACEVVRLGSSAAIINRRDPDHDPEEPFRFGFHRGV